MKLTVKTLKGSHFEITVQSSDTVMAVKKNIEDLQGKSNDPCGLQLLIHNGKFLKDETTLAENKVSEDGFLVVMLGKSKTLAQWGRHPLRVSKSTSFTSDTTTSRLFNKSWISAVETGTETVARALRAAYNHPERAVDYLYSGIPEAAEIAVPVAPFPASQVTGIGAATAPVSGLPNSSPLNMFPQANNSDETLAAADGGGGGLGSLEFLRNNPQFQALCSMVQSNPQILPPMLQELGKQNPQLLRLIEEHQTEFLQLINEPLEGSEGDAFDQPEQDIPRAINVTPAEQEAIDRLEAMGFDRALVIEAFLACDHNEEFAANYLLENAGDFED